jgi:hypothetical protein
LLLAIVGLHYEVCFGLTGWVGKAGNRFGTGS